MTCQNARRLEVLVRMVMRLLNSNARTMDLAVAISIFLYSYSFSDLYSIGRYIGMRLYISARVLRI